MLYLLFKSLRLGGPFQVFDQIEFRALAALLLSFTAVMLLAPRIIRTLMKMKIGDAPEFHNAQINELMKKKENTPTMGGIIIVAAVVISCLLLGDLSRDHGFYLWAGLICLLAHAAIGFGDDWMKLTFARRAKASGGKATRDGLRSWEKLLFQLALATILCWFVYHHALHKYDPAAGGSEMLEHFRKMSACVNLPGIKSWMVERQEDPVTHQAIKVFLPAKGLIVLGAGAFVVLGVVFVAGMSNAVNLTDGMDGLAGGISIIACLALMVLALIAGYDMQGNNWAQFLGLPHIPDSDELAVLAGAMAGACLGFLWFNCNPAQVFMGDTGSLSLGGTMGFIAVVTRQEFLMILIGGIFILEGLSVAIQVGTFKLSKGTLGFHNVKGTRRVFLCAPFHHHLHLKGWSEQKIVVRLWLVTALLAAAALATIKMR